MTMCYVGKPYDQLGERQQRRRKLQIKEDISSIATGINYTGLTITSIQLETESHMQVDIQMNPQTAQSENNDDSPDKYIPDILYLMLKHGVSLNFYQELCARFGDLPRAHKVCKINKHKTQVIIHVYS